MSWHLTELTMSMWWKQPSSSVAITCTFTLWVTFTHKSACRRVFDPSGHRIRTETVLYKFQSDWLGIAGRIYFFSGQKHKNTQAHVESTIHLSSLENTQVCSQQHNPITSLSHEKRSDAITIYGIKAHTVVSSEGLNNPSDYGCKSIRPTS